MTVSEKVEKLFRSENPVWFDYIDFVKSNYDQQRKGLKHSRKFGKHNFWIVSEDGEEIFLASINDDEIELFEIIEKTMRI